MVIAVIFIPVKTYRAGCFIDPNVPTRLSLVRGQSLEKIEADINKRKQEFTKEHPLVQLGKCKDTTYKLYILPNRIGE